MKLIKTEAQNILSKNSAIAGRIACTMNSGNNIKIPLLNQNITTIPHLESSSSTKTATLQTERLLLELIDVSHKYLNGKASPIDQ